MKSVVFAALCGMIVLAGCGEQPVKESADYVFTNGYVYTVDEANPEAQAVG